MFLVLSTRFILLVFNHLDSFVFVYQFVQEFNFPLPLPLHHSNFPRSPLLLILMTLSTILVEIILFQGLEAMEYLYFLLTLKPDR